MMIPTCVGALKKGTFLCETPSAFYCRFFMKGFWKVFTLFSASGEFRNSEALKPAMGFPVALQLHPLTFAQGATAAHRFCDIHALDKLVVRGGGFGNIRRPAAT